MFKSKKLKRALSFITASVICMFAFTQVLYAAEPIPAYSLSGTMGSLKTLTDGDTVWTSTTDTGTINIKLHKSAPGAAFSSYKLLNVENVGGVLKVSIPGDAQPFWRHYFDKSSDVTVTVKDIKENLAAIPDEAAKSNSIVSKFLSFTGPKPVPETISEVSGESATLRSEFGFYIIQQTTAPKAGYIASAPVLACLPMQRANDRKWISTYTAEPKDDQITVSKKVRVLGETNYVKETIAEIGKTLEYEIVVDLAKYGSDITKNAITYTLTDKLPEGIKYNGSATVKFYKENGDEGTPTGDYPFSYDNGTRTLTLDLGTNYKNLADFDTAKITYRATLGSSATIEYDGNENEVNLLYTSAVGKTNNIKADAKVYTHELDITKVDVADTNAALAGAAFEVYRDANASSNPIEFVDLSGTPGYATGKHYRVATADDIDTITEIRVSDAGKMNIYGLDDVTYYFKETVAPTGYNRPDRLFDISPAPEAGEKTEDEGVITYHDMRPKAYKITNESDINLPVTGGIGTIIFTVAGLLLMVGAAYVLFFSKKKSN